MDTTRESASREALKAITLQNQIASPLLRLPAEIRNQIYSLVLDNGSIKVCRQRHNAPYLGGISLPLPHVHYPQTALHLLGVCRQTYAEARLLVFELNQVVGDRVSVMQFLGLDATSKKKQISMEQASAVRAIDLELADYHCDSPWFGPPWWPLADGVGPDLQRLLQFCRLRRIVLRINRRQRRYVIHYTAISESIEELRKYVADAREQGGNRVEVEVIESYRRWS